MHTPNTHPHTHTQILPFLYIISSFNLEFWRVSLSTNACKNALVLVLYITHFFTKSLLSLSVWIPSTYSHVFSTGRSLVYSSTGPWKWNFCPCQQTRMSLPVCFGSKTSQGWVITVSKHVGPWYFTNDNLNLIRNALAVVLAGNSDVTFYLQYI